MRRGRLASALLLAGVLTVGCSDDIRTGGAQAPAQSDDAEPGSGGGGESQSAGQARPRGASPTEAPRDGVAVRELRATWRATLARYADAPRLELRARSSLEGYRDWNGEYENTRLTAYRDGSWVSESDVRDVTGEQGRESYLMRARRQGPDVWMQMREWSDGREGCWLELARREYPLGIVALGAQRSGYESVIASFRPEMVDPSRPSVVFGTVDQRAAMTLLPARVLDELTQQNVDLFARGRVFVEVRPGLDDPDLEDELEFTITGVRVAQPVEDYYDGQPPADVNGVMEDLTILLSIGRSATAPGSSSAEPPPEALRFTADQETCRRPAVSRLRYTPGAVAQSVRAEDS